MGTRVGIELSPVACRLVELQGRDVVPGRPPATRVRLYSVLPPSGPETDRGFESIGRRPVTVVVWGARSDHRQVVVSNGSYEKMRAEALASARAAGVDTRGTIADIAPASTAIKGAKRQPVILALANADMVATALRPLVEAGARIRSVIAPADALLGLARSRQAFAVPGGIEAYIALDATVTCIALVRDGTLFSARELPWGYDDGVSTPAVPHDAEAFARREDLAARLVDELAEFLTTVGADIKAVAQVSICGGLPGLRTMTVPLMERLDVEVETLDSLFGVDAEHLPEPAEEFRERAAALRLAWSAAADWRGPINLMRHRRRRDRRVALARAAVLAGVVTGLGAGWAIERSKWWQSTESGSIVRSTLPPIGPPAASAPVRASAEPRAEAPVAASASPPARPTVPTPVNTARPPVPTPSAAMLGQPSVTSLVAVPTTAATGARTPAPPAARAASPVAVARVGPAPVAPAGSAPVATARPAPVAAASATSSGRPLLAAPQRDAGLDARPSVPREEPARPPPAITVPPIAQRPADPPPVPFDAVLGTILYSPDRRFAIVNGRIVGPGDEVNGARIVDITPTTVLLRDERGRLRSLTLGSAGRTPAAP